MRIAVVGSGALGSLFGGKLANQGNDVIFYDTWKDQVEAINKNGITIIDPYSEITIMPSKVTSTFDELRERDLIFIFVKAYDNLKVLPEVQKILSKNTRVITLQNGLGNAETVASYVGTKNTIVGVTYQGGTLIKPGVMEHKAFGVTNIANYERCCDDFLIRVEYIFNQAGFETKISEDMESIIWNKLVHNIACNAYTAIVRIRARDAISSEAGKEIVRMVTDEVLSIAARKGIRLKWENPVKEIPEIINGKMPETISSMLSDVLKKRRTEIDVLNGAIVREGRSLGIPVPANEIITNLIKVIESNYDKMLFTL